MWTVQITTVLQFFLSVIFVDTCQNYSTTWIVHYKHTGSSMITDCYLINDILSLIIKLSSTIRFRQHPIHRTKFPSPQRTFLPCMIFPWSVHRDIWNYCRYEWRNRRLNFHARDQPLWAWDRWMMQFSSPVYKISTKSWIMVVTSSKSLSTLHLVNTDGERE